MEKVEVIDYLNKKNIWVDRIINNSFNVNRSVEKVNDEYNNDKYDKLLESGIDSAHELKIKQWGLRGKNEGDETFISFKDEIFKCTVAFSQQIHNSFIIDLLNAYSSSNICELGTGFGYNLSLLKGFDHVYGGELTQNGVEIGKRLGLDIDLFNFYNIKDYSFIKPNSTIFTCHALEQLPDASCFIEGLYAQKEKIKYVVNIEPSIIESRDNLLGIFRNKYLEINDYNRNLFSLLRNNPNIEIMKQEQDTFGMTPLNSSNLTVWRFK